MDDHSFHVKDVSSNLSLRKPLAGRARLEEEPGAAPQAETIDERQ